VLVEAKFSMPAQMGPRAQPASCAMGYESFPVEKQPRHGITTHPSAEITSTHPTGLTLSLLSM